MLKKFIPKTLFTKISVVLILLGISLPMFSDSVFPDPVRKCGVVTQKMVMPKGRSEADLVFGVQFPNEFEAVDVSKTTYMRYQVGDNVCFMLPDKVSTSAGFMICMFAWIGLFVYVFYSIDNYV